MSARLLIDGYNLLFASSVFASSAGPPTLQRTREALLQFLADKIEAKLLGRTVVVFDATQAPPGLPGELVFAGMQVLFSRRGQEADDLLEELIAAHRAPRELLVVSSDHRVQRAARQRGAKYTDSEQWLAMLQRPAPSETSSAKPADPLANSAELQRWLAEFGDVDSRRLAPADKPASADAEPRSPAVQSDPPASPKKKRRTAVDREEKPAMPWNPFPPGYGEDVLDEEGK
jgi:predicted RNA-binding protein with PIN domain